MYISITTYSHADSVMLVERLLDVICESEDLPCFNIRVYASTTQVDEVLSVVAGRDGGRVVCDVLVRGEGCEGRLLEGEAVEAHAALRIGGDVGVGCGFYEEG